MPGALGGCLSILCYFCYFTVLFSESYNAPTGKGFNVVIQFFFVISVHTHVPTDLVSGQE